MSLNTPNYWASCQDDILLMVLKKLDLKSLMNCMNVNNHWRNIVEYYCEHFNLWKEMVQYSLEGEEVPFSEKSMLGWRELYYNANRWLNIGNLKVRLEKCYKFECGIRSIYVYKDNLVILLDNPKATMRCYNINNFELRSESKKCLKYEETSSMIVKLTEAQLFGNFTYYMLVLYNKLFNDKSMIGDTLIVENNDLFEFKTDSNTCYEYRNNVLRIHTANEYGWESKTVAKYHGVHEFWCLHIHKNKVYILLRSGEVLLLDKERRLLTRDFYVYLPQYLMKSHKPFMFHVNSLLFKAICVNDEQKWSQHFKRCNYFFTNMSRFGVTCALEHGRNLILGFYNGDIEIFRTKKLLQSTNLKDDLLERKLNLQTYLNKMELSDYSLRINSLDVYEDNAGHHLYVSTCKYMFEFLF